MTHDDNSDVLGNQADAWRTFITNVLTHIGGMAGDRDAQRGCRNIAHYTIRVLDQLDQGKNPKGTKASTEDISHDQ